MDPSAAADRSRPVGSEVWLQSHIGLECVVGALKTDSAAINTGKFSSIAGVVTTTSGAINIGARSVIDGALTSLVAGAITLEYNVDVKGALATHTGAITSGARSQVSGSVYSNDGAITVGGNIETALAGAIQNQGAPVASTIHALNPPCALNPASRRFFRILLRSQASCTSFAI